MQATQLAPTQPYPHANPPPNSGPPVSFPNSGQGLPFPPGSGPFMPGISHPFPLPGSNPFPAPGAPPPFPTSNMSSFPPGSGPFPTPGSAPFPTGQLPPVPFPTAGSGPFPTGAPGGYPPQYVPQVQPQAATGAGGGHTDQLRQFWQTQMQEVQGVGTDPAEFKNHQLPLARIKKVRTYVLLAVSACMVQITSMQPFSVRSALMHVPQFQIQEQVIHCLW